MCFLNQIALNITHVIYYSLKTKHKSNIQFPVTCDSFRLMCDKDIFHFFFEDLN